MKTKLFSPIEVANLLDRDRETVYLYIKRGTLHAVDINPTGKKPRYRITGEEIERFKRENGRVAYGAVTGR
jgi:hypothetical protein